MTPTIRITSRRATSPWTIRAPRFTAASWPTVWSRYAGSGLSFNNNYAGLALGLSGTAYLGVMAGSSPFAAAARPRLP